MAICTMKSYRAQSKVKGERPSRLLWSPIQVNVRKSKGVLRKAEETEGYHPKAIAKTSAP